VKKYRQVARLFAALLLIALTGPSLVPLACDWMCASAHRPAADGSGSGCHEHRQQPDTPVLSAGHGCHEPVAGAILIRPSTAPLVLVAALARTAYAAVDSSAEPLALATTPLLAPTGSSRITPPLRI
jgi:hypothetical protein